MANTYVDYTATAAQTDFAFSFPYLEDSHVVVEIDGVTKTLTTHYTISTSPSTKVVLTSGATAGEVVRVKRSSDATTDFVDFVDGSVLTEIDLDKSYRHNRYLNEETNEGSAASLALGPGTTNYDARNRKIVNVADPTLVQDASTKNYVDTQIASTVTGSSTAPTKETFTGDGSSAFTFAADVTLGEDEMYEVAIDGVLQEPTVAYAIDADANTITFTSAPPTSSKIVVVQRGYNIPFSADITTANITDLAITTAKIDDLAVTTGKLANSAVTVAKLGSLNTAPITATGTSASRTLATRAADVINVLDYGVVVDDSSAAAANVTAFNAAITAALTSASVIVLPVGRMYLNAAITITMPSVASTVSNGLRLVGQGKKITQLTWTAAASTYGLVINLPIYTSSEHGLVTVEDMEFLIQQSNVGTALMIVGEAQISGSLIMDRVNQRCLIKDVSIKGELETFHGWSRGLALDNVHITVVEGVNVCGRIDNSLNTSTNKSKAYQVSVYGIHVLGNASPTNLVFDKCYVQAVQFGLLIQESIEGMFVTNSTFIVCTYGVYMAMGDVSVAHDAKPMLNVLNCHFDIFSAGIEITNVHQANIQSNNFIVRPDDLPAYSGDADVLAPASITVNIYSTAYVISGNIFYDTETGSRGPSIACEGQHGLIEGNLFHYDADTPADEPKIYLLAGSFNNTVRNNKITRQGFGSSGDLDGGTIAPIIIADTYLTFNQGATHKMRLVGGVTNDDFTAHEIITGGTSNATGIVRRPSIDPDGNDLLVFERTYGQFSASETITGAVSGAHASCASTITALPANDVNNKGVAYYTTGWVNEDDAGSAVAVANAATLVFDHDTQADDLKVDVWVSTDANGTGAVQLQAGDYQITTLTTYTLTVQLASGGYTTLNSSGVATTGVTFASKYVKVVATGA